MQHSDALHLVVTKALFDLQLLLLTNIACLLAGIHPDTHTPDMFSWFPMYIPLQTPFFARSGDVIRAAFWRKTANSKVRTCSSGGQQA